MSKPWRCRVGWHDWVVTASTKAGLVKRVCIRPGCDRTDDQILRRHAAEGRALAQRIDRQARAREIEGRAGR